MGNKIDETSYSLGYEVGWEAAKDDAYTHGWQDAVETYESRLRTLEAEKLILEARVSALSRRK